MDTVQEHFTKIELERGVSGILGDLSDFCAQCAIDARRCGDTESAREYSDYRLLVMELGSKIHNLETEPTIDN